METIDNFINTKQNDKNFMKKYKNEIIYTNVYHELLKKNIEAIFFIGKKEIIYKGSTNGVLNVNSFIKI